MFQIQIKGAKVHNLKNVSVDIPRDAFVVITGPSGSGKSSLAFDTIYAEGQRRYVESLSTYARQFLDQMEKPDVDEISGLSPTISIEQQTSGINPRSTVGTVTEIYDYLRVLYSKISKPRCWKCARPIESQSQTQIVDILFGYPEGTKLSLLAPLVQSRKGEYQKELFELRQKGFVRVRIDGETRDLSENILIEKNKKHSIELYIDRLVLKNDQDNITRARIAESLELAMRMGKGGVVVLSENASGKEERLFSSSFACQNCKLSYPTPEPRLFSFNSPIGACEKCDGLGYLGEEEVETEDPENNAFQIKPKISCAACLGRRLKKESLHFFISDKSIVDLTEMTLADLVSELKTLKLTSRQSKICERVVKDILERLHFLCGVGVDYLTLSRPAQTLSGGESQRIRLATQLGSQLVGVIYVLDEPSIGLHPADHSKLLKSLMDLRDRGNSVLVVEHDRETIEAADWIIDLGPGAGALGGEVISYGTLSQLKKKPIGLTAQYLRGDKKITPPLTKKPPADNFLTLAGLTKNNLQNITVSFPLGRFICVTGVSGGGKSSLVMETLYPLLMREIYKSSVGDLLLEKASGLEHIDKVVDINQKPIGRTPRSNPATYVGLFSVIRDLFSQIPEAQIRGYKPGRFSFNVKGGRCEVCEGGGQVKIEMHFLPNVYVPCEACLGKRYNLETLSVRFKGKNISEVLGLTVSEALHFFDAIPLIKSKLAVLDEVGLGYIQLGQAATSLSGGEAQRIKLSKELSKRGTGKTFYILDEPSTGLHFDDIKKLLSILQQLVDQGNTVLVVEHCMEIVAFADHVIDLGPGAGKAGGKVVVVGHPSEISNEPKSLTGVYLKKML